MGGEKPKTGRKDKKQYKPPVLDSQIDPCALADMRGTIGVNASTQTLEDSMHININMRMAVAGFVLLASVQAGIGVSFAAPVTYSFTTGATAFGGALGSGGPFVSPSLFTGGASGTFTYDSEALLSQVNADGSAIYRGNTPQSVTGFVTSLADLSGTVAGRTFSDVSGSTQVGNDTLVLAGTTTPVDVFQLLFDPQLTSTSTHNFTGFEIDGFTLYRVRLFWIETQAVPGVIPDFLSNQNLLAAPPTFSGRMGLDFFQTSNPSAQSVVFFDDVRVQPVAAIPEPETYAMLLAGLGLLGFEARRRRKLQHTAV